MPELRRTVPASSVTSVRAQVLHRSVDDPVDIVAIDADVVEVMVVEPIQFADRRARRLSSWSQWTTL